LIGIVATIESPPDAGLDQRSLVESCPYGWWSSAKIDRCCHVVAFMTDADQTAQAGFRPPELWRNVLRTATATAERTRALGAAAPRSIRVASATTSRMSNLAGTDWAAVGDSANTVDPLSGRGVEYALSDGITAARARSGPRARGIRCRRGGSLLR
jgi:2-polyprenyl-6-methoxyphenol hydroxylase-like FAD-dependent oxidoreductase